MMSIGAGNVPGPDTRARMEVAVMIAWDLTVFYRRGDTGGGQGLHGINNSDSIAEAARDAVHAAQEWAERTGSTIKTIPGRLLINGLKGPIDLPGLDGSLPLNEAVASAEEALRKWDAQQQQSVTERDTAALPERKNADRDGLEGPRYDIVGGHLAALWQDLASTGALDDTTTPGATDNDLAAAENHTGYRWPDEIRELFSLHPGGIEIVPMFRLLSLNEAITTWDMWMQITDDLRERWPEGSVPDESAIRTAPAGTPAEVFVPELIPIADDAAGTSLCVDIRTGSLHGCVVEYSATAGGSRPLWSSASAMVADVVDAIRVRGTFHDDWIPTTSGTLAWQSPD